MSTPLNIPQIALTGGIGSGKSAAAEFFSHLGAFIIDSDALAHQITSPHGLAIESIRRTFGSEFISDDGSLNRPLMRDLVFNQPGQLKKLESITHPLIQQEGQKAIAKAQLLKPPYILHMIPLLFESSRWEGRFFKIITVDSSQDTQISRVQARSQLTVEMIQKIINTQALREFRLEHSDFIIDNNGSLDDLRSGVREIHEKIVTLV